jgi:hypothetical protein
MKTVLKAPAELFAISTFAEVAVWERRPELQRLFVAGAAAGKVDAAIVAAALPGLSESACRNLLRTVEHLKLIEANGAITPFGKRCGETGEATAWELGVFTFLVAKHPCFTSWPIAFRREKPHGQDRDFDSLTEAPDWFAPNPKRIWTSGFEDKARFTISSFPAHPGQSAWCRVEDQPDALLVWDLDLDTGKNLLHVEGAVPGAAGPIPFRTVDQAVPTAEVTALFASWEPRWSSTAKRVLMPYDGSAGKDGRDCFMRALTYRKPKAGQRGNFEIATVDDVPVGPSGAIEAMAWATALVLARVGATDTYVAPKAWTREWDRTVTGTPLQPDAGAAPDVATLLDQQTNLSPRLRWLLAAGVDLALE